MKHDLPFAALKVELHAGRFIWIPEIKLLCVSDLHLEKGSFFSRFATLLPPYDSHDIIEKLTQIIDRFKPDIFVALGDSFHDKHGGVRLDSKLKSQLNSLVVSVPQWIWITGNHDPDIDVSITGSRQEEIQLHGMWFRHALKPDEGDFEISGHFHPKTNVRIRGHGMGGPCFVTRRRRLIMPSFGGYTGGLSIHSPDFLQSAADPIDRVFLCYGSAVHMVAIPYYVS